MSEAQYNIKKKILDSGLLLSEISRIEIGPGVLKEPELTRFIGGVPVQMVPWIRGIVVVPIPSTEGKSHGSNGSVKGGYG